MVSQAKRRNYPAFEPVDSRLGICQSRGIDDHRRERFLPGPRRLQQIKQYRSNVPPRRAGDALGSWRVLMYRRIETQQCGPGFG